jgi:hypothetical protein
MRSVRAVLFTVAMIPLLSSTARAGDAVASGNGGTLSLGSNWGQYETYHGESFRWVRNDAEIVLGGGSGEARVAIACEGGPSLGRRTFPLFVLDASHRQVDHVVCSGAGRRTEMLLPSGAAPVRYFLHVDGGGRPVRGEQRILNFRVFGLDDLRGAAAADVVDPRSGVRLGAGWYPVEHYKGQTFRWMDGDGQIFVGASGATRGALRLLLEVGPSVGAPSASLTVRDRRGAAVFVSVLKGRAAVTIPVQLEAGENAFTLAIASANKPVPADRRRLNLRLFGASSAPR